ncbi:MAG: lipid-A-disaccharide synthase [Chitinophagaceae bacterium]
MKYYIIAGEASGDLHGSNLIHQLKVLDRGAEIRGWGGMLMEEAGAVLAKNYQELAFMGFSEVVMNLGTILRNFSYCKKDINYFRPDVLVLIDYPGFNLRMAEWAKGQGLKVVYYISPQVWAWKANRVKKIKRYVDKMLVILPFEKEFYQKWDCPVEYVGHPLVEVVKEALGRQDSLPERSKPLIALLPGSRRQEVLKKLPEMLKMTRHFPEYDFVVAQAANLEDKFLQEIIGSNCQVRCWKNKTYALLKNCQAALVTSGTATLETALFGVPEVVCYRGSWISYFLAKRLVRVKFISLVNLIMDKEVVRELIQDDLREDNLRQELNRLLRDEAYIRQMKSEFAQLWTRLGDGHASRKAARAIFFWINGQQNETES